MTKEQILYWLGKEGIGAQYEMGLITWDELVNKIGEVFQAAIAIKE